MTQLVLNQNTESTGNIINAIWIFTDRAANWGTNSRSLLILCVDSLFIVFCLFGVFLSGRGISFIQCDINTKKKTHMNILVPFSLAFFGKYNCVKTTPDNFYQTNSN